MEATVNNASKPKSIVPPKVSHPMVADLAAMEGVPVFEMRFAVGFNNKPDLPYVDSNGGVGRLRASPTVTIDYLPKAMLFRVVAKRNDVGVKTFYIPREWAVFEPLE